MKTTKTIMYKYKAIYNVRYAETELVDEHWNTKEVLPIEVVEAGYSWEKDIEPVLALVSEDHKNREIVLTVEREVIVYQGSMESTEDMTNRTGCGADEL